MKKSALLIVLAVLGVVLCTQAQVYSPNIVGYVNKQFPVGDTLFTPPLWTSNNFTGPQYLSQIFAVAPPEDTTIRLWNPETLSFLPSSTFTSGAWSINYNLKVGIGAVLTAPTLFTNTFVGEVDSRGILGPDSIVRVPHPPLGNGIFLLGSIMPFGTSTFEQVIGRAPMDGEQVIKLDNTYTYNGMLGWRDQANNAVVPTLAVAEAAFFNLGPVPEPSALVLAGLGTALLLASRRRMAGR